LGFVCRTLGMRVAAGAPPYWAERPVRGIWRMDDGPLPPDARQDLRDMVVVPPGAAGGKHAETVSLAGRLARSGAAALACRPRRPADGACDGVSGEASGGTYGPTPDGTYVHPCDGASGAAGDAPAEPAADPETEPVGGPGLPVLVVPDEVPWSKLAQTISDERCRLARAEARLPGDVLARLRTPPGRSGGVRGLVEWLARTVGGAVTVTDETGQVLAAAPPNAKEVLAPVAAAIAQVAAGRHRSAAVDTGDARVRLLSLGDRAPSAVLAVAVPGQADRSAAHAVGYAADALPLLLRVWRARANERRTQEALAAARVGVLQMLMGGQLALAQRTAAVMSPGLLDADEGRVLILMGRPEDRDATVEECVRATCGRALVVRCPVYDTNVIVVAPARRVPARALPGLVRTGEARPANPPAAEDAVTAGLRGVVAGRHDRYLGGSGLTQLTLTADAYREAAHALAVARQVADRVVVHSEEAPLVHVLDERAHGWARSRLAPILALRGSEREQLLELLRLILEFGVAGAARVAGRHRNTVSAARRRAADLLGVDLDDVLVRAGLDLALQVLARTAAGAGPDTPAGLMELLTAAPARHWAERWLAPLDGDRRDLRRTLLAWVACNTHVSRAADRLGLYPDTVREQLKAADRLLGRDLMSPSGPHDPALALLAVGALPPPAG
jgi:hypothetical protein